MIHANGLRKAGKRVLVCWLATASADGQPRCISQRADRKSAPSTASCAGSGTISSPIATLTPIRPLAGWRERAGIEIPLFCGDVTDYEFIAGAMRAFAPDAVIHFAEQRSAPFWMIDERPPPF